MINPSPAKQRAQLAHLALARLPGEEVAAERRLEWAVYQGVLLAAGIDPQTLESGGERYDAADVVARWVEPLSGSWEYLHARVPGFPPRRHMEWSPICALGCALRGMFGLTHKQIGNHRGGYYRVDLECLERQRDLLRGNNMARRDFDIEADIERRRRLREAQRAEQQENQGDDQEREQ